MKAIATVLLALLVSGAACGGDNPTLKRLFDDDQSDRAPERRVERSLVEQRDQERQRIALELLQKGSLTTANDYYHAATVFQHAESADDIHLAYSLATVAWRIDPAHAKARWLAAAAWDRTMQRKNKPQWYGTQFIRDKQTLKWVLYPIDEGAVTDEERERYGVRPLAKVGDLLRTMNSE
jgi:hypothetical protein